MRSSSSYMLAAVAATSFSSAVMVLADSNSDDGHEHFHGHGNDLQDCACAADDLGISIDCSNGEAMTQALGVLLSKDCQKDCSSDECIESYTLIQIHHDYCYHDEMPQIVESEFHDFEDACVQYNCKIFRKPDESKDDCPDPVCSGGLTGAGNVAYAALVKDNCVLDCNVGDCPANFRILRAEHDLCDTTVLAANVEEGMHNLEDVCSNHTCNVWHHDDGDLRICSDNSLLAKDDGDDEITTGAIVGIVFALVFGIGIFAFIVSNCFCASARETATKSVSDTSATNEDVPAVSDDAAVA